MKNVTLTRWDPFRDLLEWHNGFGRELQTAWRPAIDILETEDAYKVVADLPGFNPDEVDVTVDEGTLTIKGERKFYDEVKEENFHRVERRFGSFERAVRLPRQVQADKIEATFDKGVLTVGIPKAEESKPRRVEIKS